MSRLLTEVLDFRSVHAYDSAPEVRHQSITLAQRLFSLVVRRFFLPRALAAVFLRVGCHSERTAASCSSTPPSAQCGGCHDKLGHQSAWVEVFRTLEEQAYFLRKQILRLLRVTALFPTKRSACGEATYTGPRLTLKIKF